MQAEVSLSMEQLSMLIRGWPVPHNSGVLIHPPHQGQRAVPLLSLKQSVVANMLKRGMSRKDIGTALNVNYKTIDNHARHIYRKLGVHSQVELMNAMRGAL